MAYTFTELKHMKLAQLKEIAAGLDQDEVKGYTQMNKEHLLKSICTALKIEMHEHHEVTGLDKKSIKLKIRALKKERDNIIKNKDKAEIIRVRKEIKSLKNALRKAVV
jgi:hypothetical protein